MYMNIGQQKKNILGVRLVTQIGEEQKSLKKKFIVGLYKTRSSYKSKRSIEAKAI